METKKKFYNNVVTFEVKYIARWKFLFETTA